jgi:uncharacterized protein (TIGR03000 family)
MLQLKRSGLLALALTLAALPLGLAIAQSPEVAYIRVLLPPDGDKATVAFGDKVTKEQTGRDRLYVTPPLPAGGKYYYDLVATWTGADGKEVKRTRRVDVTRGQTAVVDLSEPDKEPEKKPDDKKTDKKVEQAKSDIRKLDKALEVYKTLHMKYPAALKDVTEPEGKIPAIADKNVLVDPWGKPYEYEPNNLHPVTKVPHIFTNGPAGGKLFLDNWDSDAGKKTDDKKTDDKKTDPQEQGKIDRAKVDVKILEKAVQAYKVLHNNYPEALEALTQADGKNPALIEDKALLDPWGKAYVYEPNKRHPKTDIPHIYSNGPPGSKMPIANWDSDAKTDDGKKGNGDKSKTALKTRTFSFTYGATLSKLPAGKTVRVWFPVPTTTSAQDITIEKTDLPEGKTNLDSDPTYGNKIQYFEAMPDKDGKITFAVTYKVTRREVRTTDTDLAPIGAKEKTDRFLQPDKLVPIDGKPLTLLMGITLDKDSRKAGRQLYDIVNSHMKYSKVGEGWGRGDSNWACDSKFGNCSDFHSLFISLARAQKMPAKYMMGFPLPAKHGEGTLKGCHCWAAFSPDGKGWIPVDISEANQHPEMRDYYFGNLTENRVQFTVGRDIELVPRQSGPPLNFLIYPYAEVDGQPLPESQIEGKYSYCDI